MNRTSTSLALALVLGATVLFSSACSVDRPDPPEYGLYFAFAMHAQAHGLLDPGLPAIDIQYNRIINAGPELTPDRQEGAAPPFCMAFTFSSTVPPALINGDAGTIIFDGFEDAQMQDLTMGPVPRPPEPVPSPVECNIIDLAGTKPYSCAPVTPIMMAPPGSTPWITDDTRMDITMTGGEHIGAFTETGIASPVPLEPAFDYATLTPDSITVSWEETEAEWVMVEVLGQLISGAAQAQILCLERGSVGSKTISPAMLELLPTPTATDPLFIQVSGTAHTLRSEYKGWGSYMVGIGRGFFSQSCFGPDGPCPTS